MQAQWIALLVAIAVDVLATVAERQPFSAAIHHWEYTLAVALAIIALAVLATGFLRSPRLSSRASLLAALGGIVTGVAFVAAELLAGPPQRVNAAPGQAVQLAHSSSITLAFPAVQSTSLGPDVPVAMIALSTPRGQIALKPGDSIRIHSFVVRCDDWPAAYVTATSSAGQPETVTQPTGVAFVSPVLQFPSLDSDGLPLDSFAVPALHRQVDLKYYPGLPSRGIDIPFVQLQIKEENGAALFEGVAVSGHPLTRAGMTLLFSLGRYPIASVAGSPDPLLYAAGCIVTVIGLGGFVVASLRRQEVASVA